MPKLPVPTEFVRVLAPALRQAASIARALEGRVVNRPKSGERTAVKQALTLADTASQEAILVPLLEHFPQVRLEAEEDTASAARFPLEGEALVVVDPIDGTLRFYLEGRGPYAVMAGLAIHEQYEAALVALPREELTFHALRGGGAVCALGSEEPKPARAAASGSRVLVSYDLPEAALESLTAHGLRPEPASGGAIAVAPLLPDVRAGLRWVREGTAGVSTRGRIGALISAEAGALVAAAGGAPFPGQIQAPAPLLYVAAEPSDLEILREAVRAAGGPD